MKLFALTLASFSLLASAPVLADPTRLREDVRAVAPALEKYALGTLLGDVWKRPGLSLRDRSIVTLAALITRNQTAEMADYLNLALDNGVKPAEVSETITHLAFYSGWGNAMSAVPAAKDVFAARKITSDQLAAVSPNRWRSTRPPKRIASSVLATSSAPSFRGRPVHDRCSVP
jgi:4-carboxymuconolactone decarboxylase